MLSRCSRRPRSKIRAKSSQKRLENDKTLKKRTSLNVDDIMELLKFVLETTYFRFEGEIWSSHGLSGIPYCCQPVHGGPGAENNSHSTGRLPIEKLETICGRCNVPGTYRKVKKLQQHMNTVDPTGSIIFKREDEGNNSMPFLDAKFTRKEGGSVKSTVYRKKTHTNQYLNFASHHPKHQKLGVVRTLMNRCETITSEEGDKKEEVEHLRGALRVCGYPFWALNKMTDSSKNKKKKK